MTFVLLLAAAFVIFLAGYIFGCCQDGEKAGSFVINSGDGDPTKELFEIKFDKDPMTLKKGDAIVFEVDIK